jgi:hypothetical protein
MGDANGPQCAWRWGPFLLTRVELPPGEADLSLHPGHPAQRVRHAHDTGNCLTRSGDSAHDPTGQSGRPPTRRRGGTHDGRTAPTTQAGSGPASSLRQVSALYSTAECLMPGACAHGTFQHFIHTGCASVARCPALTRDCLSPHWGRPALSVEDPKIYLGR